MIPKIIAKGILDSELILGAMTRIAKNIATPRATPMVPPTVVAKIHHRALANRSFRKNHCASPSKANINGIPNTTAKTLPIE